MQKGEIGNAAALKRVANSTSRFLTKFHVLEIYSVSNYDMKRTAMVGAFRANVFYKARPFVTSPPNPSFRSRRVCEELLRP